MMHRLLLAVALALRCACLDLGTLHLPASGAIDPNQMDTKEQLMRLLGVNVIQVTPFSSNLGLNGGMWTLSSPVWNGAEKILKYRATDPNTPAQLAHLAEAEQLKMLAHTFPDLARDPDLAFPFMVISCLGNGGVKQGDFILTRKVPGEMLAVQLAYKHGQGDAAKEELYAILMKVGRQLRAFHGRYGEQHRDFHVANILVDTNDDNRVTFVDLSGIGMDVDGDDLSHFKEGLQKLKEYYQPASFLDDGYEHFLAGYEGRDPWCKADLWQKESVIQIKSTTDTTKFHEAYVVKHEAALNEINEKKAAMEELEVSWRKEMVKALAAQKAETERLRNLMEEQKLSFDGLIKTERGARDALKGELQEQMAELERQIRKTLEGRVAENQASIASLRELLADLQAKLDKQLAGDRKEREAQFLSLSESIESSERTMLQKVSQVSDAHSADYAKMQRYSDDLKVELLGQFRSEVAEHDLETKKAIAKLADDGQQRYAELRQQLEGTDEALRAETRRICDEYDGRQRDVIQSAVEQLDRANIDRLSLVKNENRELIDRNNSELQAILQTIQAKMASDEGNESMQEKMEKQRAKMEEALMANLRKMVITEIEQRFKSQE